MMTVGSGNDANSSKSEIDRFSTLYIFAMICVGVYRWYTYNYNECGVTVWRRSQ